MPHMSYAVGFDIEDGAMGATCLRAKSTRLDRLLEGLGADEALSLFEEEGNDGEGQGNRYN
jgi:hypothetical protein